MWSSGNDDKNLPFPAPGEPLETHEHGNITLHQWMVRNVPGYSQDRSHPVAVELNGRTLPPMSGRFAS